MWSRIEAEGVAAGPDDADRAAVGEFGLLRSRMTVDAPKCWILAALLAAFLCPSVEVDATAPRVQASPDKLLAQAEEIRSADPQRFGELLNDLRDQEKSLSVEQRWQLRFLEAAQLSFQGRYAQAEPVLKDVIAHAPGSDIRARATAALLQSRFLARDYQTAYTLAHELIANLPQLTDTRTRRTVLDRVVQMLNSAGQHELALQYARKIKSSFPSGKGQCSGNLSIAQTLLYAGKLAPDSPEIADAVASCLRIGELASANALRLDVASLMLEQGHPRQSLALLERIAPSIHRAKYQFHVGSLHMELAEAYARLGDDDKARKFALQSLADNDAGAVNFVVESATKVLFEVEKRAGHSAAALSWYEKHVAQKQLATDDAKARALAYQMVRQDVLNKQMKLDALSRQNSILALRQTLADKAAETSRLYIALLILLLAFIVIWLYRTKHAQIRFRRMAQHDDLTGVFNRQHFLELGRRALERLQRSELEACLVLLDLDYFKQVNDQHGHATGDEVLTQTVAVCRDELRPHDIFGRLGGEEFGILLPACSSEAGIGISNRIRRSLASAKIRVGSGQVVQVSASFGLACSAKSGHDLTTLLRVADAALYRAKRAGRNQLAVGGRPGDDIKQAVATSEPGAHAIG